MKKKKKVVLVHKYGPQKYDKVKEPANEVAVLPRKTSVQQGCWNKGNRRFFGSHWSQKNRSEKCEGPGRGGGPTG